jgi:chorismate synthase
MAGSTIGSFFRITTFGESHGIAVGVVIDGVQPNIFFPVEEIQRELDRRRPGQSTVTTPRKEEDTVHVLSGVYKGKTLGTPICLVIWNKDQNSKAYDEIKDMFRPGHAGYTYLAKYGIHDYRGGGRSSGRETAGRVAAGGFAKSILAKRGIKIYAYTKEIGGIVAKNISLDEIENNSVRCADKIAARKMEQKILRAKKEGDSLGGIIEVVVQNCPAGLGEPVFDKLEADFAKALLSIPAVKGFEIGSGFSSARMKGSEHNDEFYTDAEGHVRTKTNFAGGILGGISNGENILMRIAVKPTSSIAKEQKTVSTKGVKRIIKVEGRHDPCLLPRVVPVVESMIALVLAEHLMRQNLLQKKNKSVTRLRKEIDLIDDMLLLLLNQRKELVREVGEWKKKKNIFVPDPLREKNIMARILLLLPETNLEKEFVEQLFQLLFEDSKRIQSELRKKSKQ